VLDRLSGVRSSNGSHVALCPAHDDRQQSLSVSEGDDGRALLHCHAGCTTDDVLAAVKLELTDLFAAAHRDSGGIAATFDYTDEDGALLFQVVRFEPKGFRQRRPDGRGGWIWNLKGVRRVLYRLPAVRAAVAAGDTVYVAEGEKDADALARAGVCTTTNPQGAGKWTEAYTDALAGAARVVVVADRDEPGRAHARKIAEALGTRVERVTIVEAIAGKDAADHLAAGHTVDELEVTWDSTASPLPAPTSVGVPPTPKWSGEPGWRALDRLDELLRRYVAWPANAAVTAVALWAAHTWVADRFDTTPRLALLSPEKRCGKTRVLELLELVCRGAERLSDASPAYMFRRTAAGEVTIMLDEADAIWKRGKADEAAEALRSLVNSGHRQGAFVGRVQMVGQDAKLCRFPSFAPVALAGIGDCLPDTVIDRAVVVRMRRRMPGDRIEAFRWRRVRDEGGPIADALHAWAHACVVLDPGMPDMPAGIEDRAADVWEPLILLADLAGGDWPARARAACLALNADRVASDPGRGTQLLADVRAVLDGQDRMHSATIVEKLNALEESPWGGWHRGDGLKTRDLARELKAFDVRSRDVRIDATVKKGYLLEDLTDAFDRYLPGGSATPATSATPLASPVADVAPVADPPPDDDTELF
jgi:5S rRNA maturation endonuclease (ribonuclease M5)